MATIKEEKKALVRQLAEEHPNDDLNSFSLRQLRQMEKDDFNARIRAEDEAERNQWNNLILNPQREDDITDYYAYRRTRTADPKEIERLNQEEANSLRLFKTHQEAKDNLKNPELSKAGNMLGSKRNFVLSLKNTAADIQNELRNEQQSQSVNGRMSEESAGQVVGNTEVSPVQKHAPAQPVQPAQPAQPVQPAQPKSTPAPQPTPQPQQQPTRYTPSVQSMNGIKVSKLPTHTDAYEERNTVTNQPSVETKTTQFGLPDAQTQEYIRKNIIEPTQKAYGVNPNTGDITPFQALGYNPEDERKRREAEMALNDRKRKENAWYNAFAVVGDALTAGLGGNVWKRQPNRIGQQAIADNQRLIAEQKAEDEGNAAKLRNAGTAYANTVNRLIQNYLSKTTTTNKTGGDSVETTIHQEQNGYRYVSVPEKQNNNGSGRGSGRGSNSDKYVNINVTNTDGSTKKNRYEVTKEQYKALQGILKEHYNKILSRNDDQARQLENALTNSHVITGMDSRGQYIYDMDQLLQNGKYWMLDDATMDRIEKEIGGKAKFKRPESNKNRNLKAPWLQLQTNNSNKAPWLK